MKILIILTLLLFGCNTGRPQKNVDVTIIWLNGDSTVYRNCLFAVEYGGIQPRTEITLPDYDKKLFLAQTYREVKIRPAKEN